jgi:indolepyruvate ferredoxin oxidoreductase
MALAQVSMDDRYALDRGRVYLTGIHALVRALLDQRARDRAAGLDTAGFVSGYRGSPLGGFDKALADAERFLGPAAVRFQPGVNEDLAATAVWGSQQVGLFDGARHDGVFGVWYGKGPGVDRSGDVFKHANAAGTAPHGGVLALIGDDHACKSSTLAHQSEFALVDAMIPVLNPAGVQEVLDFAPIGWAMSRFTGLWVGMKTIAETMDSSASVMVGIDRATTVVPTDAAIPPGGLAIRWPDKPVDQEERLHRFKLPAALAFARANRLDRVALGGPARRLGIVTTGKSYLDLRQALVELGLDEGRARTVGLSIYKVAMPWPLEPEGLTAFAAGLDELLVVEEKRGLIEPQVKEVLYHLPADRRPRVVGRADEAGRPLLPSAGELSPTGIAMVVAARLANLGVDLGPAVAQVVARERRLADKVAAIRTPTFCSGCPHNSSTKVPEGSRALAGIGCHYMAIWMDRRTETFSQMGGEGVAWVGQAPFTDVAHVFVNIGDGTYFHSGHMAIRQAVSAGVNATYKLLFNDAVAMTGGQAVDDQLTVDRITRLLAAEGVGRIVVVSDEPEKYPIGMAFAPGVTVHHRDRMDAIQRELRTVPGVTAIVYDQTCATEKRRRRKRGTMADPARRVVINEAVCEGCGDCGMQSNCVSILPVETEYGRKRQIDQSTCNKDMACVDGFCPSFVTVEGGRLRKPAATGGELPIELPTPPTASVERPWNIVVNGVGGTGVVTIGALLGAAAHVEGRAVTVLDMTGLAQKGGAVWSHVRIAADACDIHAVRVTAEAADLVIGADLVTTGGGDTLARVRADHTRLIVNDHETMTAEFTRDADHQLPVARLKQAIRRAAGATEVDFLDATRIATRLMGDSIATNAFMLGLAAQRGLLPVSVAALERAIELNGVAVAFNKRAFAWGRAAAIDRAAVLAAARPAAVEVADHHRRSEGLDELIARRVTFLTAYQNAAWAARYRTLVDRVRAHEATLGGEPRMTAAVARNLFKLMAYKDEYEVARLHADPQFRASVASRFEGGFKLAYNLAPPIFAKRDPDTGLPMKRRFGPWVGVVFQVMARLKGLRGTALDPFGWTAERRSERQAISDYEAEIARLLDRLSPLTRDLAVEIASLPERVRGFGHVKERAATAIATRRAELYAKLDVPSAPVSMAAD